ncbi:MAG: tetratricopeptide repeat protein [Polyangiaceae bacterium]
MRGDVDDCFCSQVERRSRASTCTPDFSGHAMNETTEKIRQLLVQGIECQHAGDLAAAEELFMQCMNLDDGTDSDATGGGPSSIRLSAHVRYAMVLEERGHPRRALAVVEAASKRWPSQATVWSFLGRLRVAVGQPEGAEQAYRRSLELEPRACTWSLLYWVLKHELEGRDDEAVACLHAALDVDPDYEDAHYKLGCNLSLSGDIEAAEAHFRRAIELDPEYAAAHAELGFCLMGRQDLTPAGAAAEALPHLVRSVEIDGNYGWSRLYLGIALWEVRRLRDARVQFEAACRIWPDDASALSLHGDFLSDAFGARGQAEQLLRRAVVLDPDDGDCRYRLGKHLVRMERYQEARRELERAHALGNVYALAVLDDVER